MIHQLKGLFIFFAIMLMISNLMQKLIIKTIQMMIFVTRTQKLSRKYRGHKSFTFKTNCCVLLPVVQILLTTQSERNMHKITVLKLNDYRNNTGVQTEVACQFYDLLPISLGNISKIENQFLELGRVRQIKNHLPM